MWHPLTSTTGGAGVYLMASMIATMITTTQQLDPSPLPTLYVPDVCAPINLSGFSRALLVSQPAVDSPSASSSVTYLPHCKVIISVHGAHLLRLTFEHLDLPNPSTIDGSCRAGCVQLFNGFSTSLSADLALSPPICGTTPPARDYISNTSVVSLVFSRNVTLDERKSSTAFRIKYERVTVSPSAEKPAEDEIRAHGEELRKNGDNITTREEELPEESKAVQLGKSRTSDMPTVTGVQQDAVIVGLRTTNKPDAADMTQRKFSSAIQRSPASSTVVRLDGDQQRSLPNFFRQISLPGVDNENRPSKMVPKHDSQGSVESDFIEEADQAQPVSI